MTFDGKEIGAKEGTVWRHTMDSMFVDKIHLAMNCPPLRNADFVYKGKLYRRGPEGHIYERCPKLEQVTP